MSTVQVTLPKKLKSFSEASTSSESPGFVPAGTYELKELKQNYPNQDTDYALLKSPDLGDVWICSRWKGNNYIETQAFPVQPDETDQPDFISAAGLASRAADILSRISFNDSDDAVEESDLVEIIKDYDGYAYDLRDPAYPYNLKGVNLPVAPPKAKQNNCCTFAEGLLVKAWSDTFPDFEWNNQRHGQMMIFSTDDYFSPVTAALETGMGEKVDDVEAAPNPWTLVQGWKTQWTGGHTFIIVDHHEETDKILTIESNKAFGLNGVGFRKIGMASALNNQPPENWWELPGVWTWAQIKNSYKFRAMATLKVKNRSWAGLG